MMISVGQGIYHQTWTWRGYRWTSGD